MRRVPCLSVEKLRYQPGFSCWSFSTSLHDIQDMQGKRGRWQPGRDLLLRGSAADSGDEGRRNAQSRICLASLDFGCLGWGGIPYNSYRLKTCQLEMNQVNARGGFLRGSMALIARLRPGLMVLSDVCTCSRFRGFKDTMTSIQPCVKAFSGSSPKKESTPRR